ncbi:f protein [Thysanoplusia orichalcea nucleopolyhedrovirus]|uniref:F protein n=1 Tax=Thysanoplusia orichalcea nucleopolyhedrovirus TaxID=101850 RepID=L0CJV2_9ABAC|nr:f protein [Thysanoplusia orichalcea nucleopolyhedrovirus]AGA16177.1 f protein [Thysanoplusia orichalcea nucleopolyhedrovirus]
MAGVELLVVCALISLSSAATDRITFTPIEDNSGLAFERMYRLRHYADDRFVFVKKFDFYPVLQELENVKFNIKFYEAQVLTCKNVKKIKPDRSSTIKSRIERQMQNLKQLNNNLITYSVDNNMLSNDVLESIKFEYKDSIEFAAYDDDDSSSGGGGGDIAEQGHWSNLTVSDAQNLLRNPPKDRVAFLDTVTTSYVNTKYENYTKCLINNRTAENECMFLNDMMNMLNNKLDDAAALAKMLELITKQAHRNKLNTSNSNVNDAILLTEMKKLSQALNNQNRAWVVDFNKDMDDRFDLSQVYKLHLYLENNVVIMFITMPLLNSSTVPFNLYRVVTIPFCRGKMCLFMVSNHEYFAITDSKNYYVNVPDNFKHVCKEFTGYDEVLCPESNSLATINSHVCEIEMFMGRYSNNIDDVCDIRVANYDPKKTYFNTVIDYRKWLYMFPNSTTAVYYYCNDVIVNGVAKIQPGVGFMTSVISQTCSVQMSKDDIITVASRLYSTPSTTYWPSKKFNFNNYIDQSLLKKASTSFIPTLNNFTRAALLQVRHKFHVREYTSSTPHHFFYPSKIYINTASEEKIQDSSNTTIIIVSIIIVALVFLGFVIFLYFCVKKRCNQFNNVVVQYRHNNDFVTIHNTLNEESNVMHIDLPHNDGDDDDDDDDRETLYPIINDNLLYNDKPVMYPMIIERIK